MATGECLLVVGPSGSGKSTLALALAGRLRAAGGGRSCGDLVVGGPAGIVFQHPTDQVVMERVEDDVAFGLERRAWPRPAMRARVPEALAMVGLAGFERRRTTALSGGELQRLALGGAIAPAPPILVLDEPTANLDPGGARAFLAWLRRLREAGTTIVLVEHRVELAWDLADHVLALGRDGRPIALGPPGEVVDRAGRDLAAAGIWLPPAIEARLGIQPPEPLPPGTRGAPLVVAEGLGYRYAGGEPAVNGVDLVLREAERVTLLGRNGSGKSTLGRLLVGLLRPTAGRTTLGGLQPARLPAAEIARRAGYLFQDPEEQFLAGTVVDEVMLGLRPDERRRVADLLAALGLPLEAFAERSPYALSGGEQRRLSLACVLIRRPGLLVLDEPTYGQDRSTYIGLLGILRGHLDAGTALLVATHDERLAGHVGGRRVFMDAGRLAGAA